MTTLFLLLLGVVILLCVWLNNLSSKIGVPTLLAFIMLGIVFGTSRFIPISLDDHNLAKEICTIALIFIMFYGGFGTRWDSARPIVREASLLASGGVMLTAALTGLFCHFALGWSYVEGLLLGSVVSSTDAASVFSILRSKKLGLKNNTAPLLEMESGSNDPCSYMLTLIFLTLMKSGVSGGAMTAKIIWMVFAQLFFGAAGGLGIAMLALWIFRKVRIIGDGFDSIYILAVAIISYALPSLIGGNGYLSAYIVGIMMGNSNFRNKKALVGFFDGLTGLMQVLIFFILGLLARPAIFPKVVLPALAIFAFMLLVARPLSVAAILTPFRKYSLRQQMLVSFSGLRGAASIVFAIMAASGNSHLHNDIFNIVFCIVLMSISLQGSLIPKVAGALGMLDGDSDVMKTFNDYSKDTQMQFGSVKINANSQWNGRCIKDLGLPKGLLIALVVRDGARIAPKGNTTLQKGDTVIMVSRSFEDSSAHLYEKTIVRGSEWIGKPLSAYHGDGLVLLIRRANRDIIPSGETLLQEDDALVVFRGDPTSLRQG